MEGLIKCSSPVLCSGPLNSEKKGPLAEWWNQDGCYGNHATANVSENVFDLDWWNLALVRFDFIRRGTRGGDGEMYSEYAHIRRVILEWWCIPVALSCSSFSLFDTVSLWLHKIRASQFGSHLAARTCGTRLNLCWLSSWMLNKSQGGRCRTQLSLRATQILHLDKNLTLGIKSEQDLMMSQGDHDLYSFVFLCVG